MCYFPVFAAGPCQPCAELIARSEGMAVLLQLVACEKPAVVRYCTVALANMSGSPGVHRQLLDERAVAVLTACSDTKNFLQIKQCAQTFYNFSCK